MKKNKYPIFDDFEIEINKKKAIFHFDGGDLGERKNIDNTEIKILDTNIINIAQSRFSQPICLLGLVKTMHLVIQCIFCLLMILIKETRFGLVILLDWALTTMMLIIIVRM